MQFLMQLNEINVVAVLVWESDFETIFLLFQEKFMQRYIFHEIRSM